MCCFQSESRNLCMQRKKRNRDLKSWEGLSMIGQESLCSSEHQRNFLPSNRPSAKLSYRVVSNFPLITSEKQKLHSVHFWSNRPKLSKVLPLCWFPFWWKKRSRTQKVAQLKQSHRIASLRFYSQISDRLISGKSKMFAVGFKAGKSSALWFKYR